MKALVTGAGGLIGSEAVAFYDQLGWEVIGIDNNMRKEFFGSEGDVSWNLARLAERTRSFVNFPIDIRSYQDVLRLISEHKPDLIVHCAAQPSHDKARDIPLEDFEVNALGTVNLLEATRRHAHDAVFIHMSTNKVYGDAPNEVPLIELEKRYDYAREEDYDGISEECRVDRSLHSLFGASKVAADIMAQEYGRYFGMKVGVFRGGCLTGPSHSGVQLHGFLSYLVKVGVRGEKYTVFGYKGKQVRDNIHSHDVIQAFEAFRQSPKPGEVYNLGGGRANSISILEAFDMIETITGKKIQWEYQEKARRGDHICYISDLSKLRRDFPQWEITRDLPSILAEMVNAEMEKARAGA